MHCRNNERLNCFPNTYALVLCGGNSTRMGTDKSMLIYNNKPQRYLLYDLLLNCCEEVFISCNSNQRISVDVKYEVMQDDEQYSMIGPMGALLTAMHNFPQKNILLVACDYPFLTIDELQEFSTFCNDTSAAFYNPIEKLYVPVLAWYSCNDFAVVNNLYKEGITSLQKCLFSLSAMQYKPKNIDCMISVDTRDMFMNLTGFNTSNSIE